MAQYVTQGGYVTSSLGKAKTRARREAKEDGHSYVENTESGKTVYRPPRGPIRFNSGRKKSAQKRISRALSGWLKKQNPAMKKASSVRVERLKGGAIKFTPMGAK